MQIPKNQKLYIPAIFILAAIMAVSISPMSSAIAQESADVDSSENPDGKSHDGKDGKSCDKKKERSKTTETSAEQA